MSNVKRGTKIEADEAKTLDPAKRGKTTSEVPDVEGQELVLTLTECPWCGNVGRSVVDTDKYNWYECGNCGRPFRA